MLLNKIDPFMVVYQHPVNNSLPVIHFKTKTCILIEISPYIQGFPTRSLYLKELKYSAPPMKDCSKGK